MHMNDTDEVVNELCQQLLLVVTARECCWGCCDAQARMHLGKWVTQRHPCTVWHSCSAEAIKGLLRPLQAPSITVQPAVITGQVLWFNGCHVHNTAAPCIDGDVSSMGKYPRGMHVRNKQPHIMYSTVPT